MDCELVAAARLAVPEAGWRAALLRRVPRPLSITRFRELGYPDPRLPTRAAVAGAAAWAVWKARRARDLGAAAMVGAFTVHAFVVLSVGVHEHHQLLEVPLLALAAALRRPLRPLFLLVSAIVALNINYVFGAGPRLGWAVPRMATGIDLSVLLAFVNAGALVWFARLLHAETKTSAAVASQAT